MSIYIKGEGECQNVIPCLKILRITYDWSETAVTDLDTGTIFLGGKVGYNCSPSSEYMRFVTGDDTEMNGKEIIEIEIERALNDGAWGSSVQVDCHAHWYSSSLTPKSGAYVLRVEIVEGVLCKFDAEDTRNLFTAVVNNVCSVNPVASITVYDDYTVTIV